MLRKICGLFLIFTMMLGLNTSVFAASERIQENQKDVDKYVQEYKGVKYDIRMNSAPNEIYESLRTSEVLADTLSSNDEKNVFDILSRGDRGVATRAVKNEITYTITNRDVIAQLSDSEDLPDKIELTYIPAKEVSEEPIYASRFFSSYKLKNIKDKGDGWYNSNSHQLYEFYVDGPDTFVIDETQSHTSSTNCSVSAATGVIEAGVGFKIGTSYDLHIQSKTPVPASKRFHIEIFKTHHKVTFDLYEKHRNGDWSKYGSYEALKPNGVFIKKESWNK